MARLSVEDIKDFKEKCNPKYDIDYINLIDTIEAQQQEIEESNKDFLEQTNEVDRLCAECTKMQKILEEAAEEIENCYGRDTELSERMRNMLDGGNEL